MRKFCLLPILVCGLLVFGCSDNNDDISLTPGDPNDPELVAFMSQFEGVEDFSGEMFETMFSVIDAIPDPTGAPNGMFGLEESQESPSPIYDETTMTWVASFTMTDPEEEMSFEVTQRVQFKEGSAFVQFPNEETPTQILSNLTMSIMVGSDFSGSADQSVVLDVDPVMEQVTINGNGGVDVSFAYEDPESACSGDVDMHFSGSDLVLSMAGQELQCPQGGSLTFWGGLDFACTGANEVSVSGNWTVTNTYDTGTVSRVVVDGNHSWVMDPEVCE